MGAVISLTRRLLLEVEFDSPLTIDDQGGIEGSSGLAI